jgi:hypothetical protein
MSPLDLAETGSQGSFWGEVAAAWLLAALALVCLWLA